MRGCIYLRGLSRRQSIVVSWTVLHFYRDTVVVVDIIFFVKWLHYTIVNIRASQSI